MEVPESQIIAAIAAGGGAIYWVLKSMSAAFLASYERQATQIEKTQLFLVDTLVDNKVAMQEVVRLSSEHNRHTLQALEGISRSQQDIVRSLENLTYTMGTLSRNGVNPNEESDSSYRTGSKDTGDVSDLPDHRQDSPHDQRGQVQG